MIKINLDRARGIAHDLRRQSRGQEFLPLDTEIARRIPGVDLEAIERQRQAIREHYHQIQASIDQAQTVAQLEDIVTNLPKNTA
jgi:hypothetical protein